MGGRTRPNNSINPKVFEGEGLKLEGWDVMIAGYEAGYIRPPSHGENLWSWGFTAGVMLREWGASSGYEESKEAAKLAFRICFDRWLNEALRRGGNTSWRGADSEWGHPPKERHRW